MKIKKFETYIKENYNDSSILPYKVEKYLEQVAPDNATSWSEATDEIRDLARKAKEFYNEYDLNVSNESPDAHQPLDFSSIDTPSEWNKKGKEYFKETYKKMSFETRRKLIDYYFG